jgi:hypothetical protein
VDRSHRRSGDTASRAQFLRAVARITKAVPACIAVQMRAKKASVIIRRCSVCVEVAFRGRQFITVNYYFWLGCRRYLLGSWCSGSGVNLRVEVRLRPAPPILPLPAVLFFVHDG